MSDLDTRIWHDTKTAAKYTGFAQITVLRALESGELNGFQRSPRARGRIHVDALDAWMRGEAA